MKVSVVMRSRVGSLLAVIAIAMSVLVAGAGSAHADVTGVSSTTTSQVEAGTTATLAGLMVTASVGTDVVVNLSTTKGTLSVDTGTGISLSYGYSSSGTELAFSGTRAQVNAALATVKLSTSASLKGQSATVSISARSVDTLTYSAETGHYYKYVAHSGISWSAARSAASSSSYRGQSGYLATVPSSSVNSLIASRIQGATSVWLGGIGMTNSGGYGRQWMWADGPLQNHVFTRCSNATGSCTFVDSGSFYYAWASGEPNNASGNEPSIVTNWNGTSGAWNDLADGSSGASGYVVEYGNRAFGADSWTGIYSDSSSVLLAGVPSAPTSVSANPGEGEASVSFSAPTSDYGSAIDLYRVTMNPGGVEQDCTSPCTFTGLTPAQEYSFTVKAHNAYGWSGASGTVTATPGIRPGTPSGAPTLLIVGNGPAASVTASGYPAPTYTVTSGSLPSGVTLNPTSGALGGAPTATGSFSFEVTATNTYGAKAATFTGDIESIPTIETTSFGTVRWSEPYDAMLSASAVPGETWSVTGGALPDGLTLESTGRLHGTPTTVGDYSVQITATNTHGSDATTFTGAVAPIPATAPTIGTATPGNASLSITFSAPTNTGGSPITGYEYSLNGGGTWLTGPAGVTTSPVTITGLSNGTGYSVMLRAVTAAGGGAASGATSATPRTVPDSPTPVTATPGEGQVSVSFAAPSFDGGNTIDQYRVTTSPGGAQTVCSSPCVIGSLTVGQEYTFTVQAHNAAGWSAASSAASATPGVRPGSPSGVPTLLIVGQSPSATVTASGYPAPTFSVTSGSLPAGVTLNPTTGALGGSPTATGVFTVQVTASNLHGDTATTFIGAAESVPSITTATLGTIRWGTAYDTTLTASAVPDSAWTVTAGALPSGLTLESDGQLHGTPTAVGPYSVQITATNTHGADAVTYTGTVDAIAATAPAITDVTADDTTLTFTFTPPASLGGASITGYQYSLDGGSSWQAGPFGVTSSPLTIGGLANGTTYSVMLRAVTVAGGGAASEAAAGTPRTVASAPTLDVVTAGDHSLVVDFTPPVDDGGDAVVGYRFSVDGGTTWSTEVLPLTASPLTIFGLENGQTYEVALAAVNAAGDGASSAAMSGVPVAAPVTIPGEDGPPELGLGLGVGVENGAQVPVTSGSTGVGWKVSGPSVSVSLEAYDLHAKLVAGSGGGAYLQVYRGGYVLVSGEGFKPGSTADVWMFSTPTKLGSLTVDGDGTFSGMLRLPTSLTVGAHTIQVNGVTTADVTSSTSLGLRVGNAPRGLASTGASVGWALAAQMMCAGAALVIVGRRRLAH